MDRSFSLRVFALWLLATLGGWNSPLSARSTAEEHVPERVVVVLRPDFSGLSERIAGPEPWASGRADLDLMLDRIGAREMVCVVRSGGETLRDPALFNALGLDRHYVIELEPGTDAVAVRAELARDPLVVEARLDAMARAASHPNDPLYPQQWNHHQASGSFDPDVDTSLAWDLATGGAGIRVAVLDTGVHQVHPDLAGALLPGYDFVSDDASPDDDNGHGTSVIGIIAARGNNGIGLAGIAWSASILPVKVLDSIGTGSWSDIAAGITWAANNGADVINMSLGGYGYDSGVAAALAYAAGLDALCVASSGDDDQGTITYPAAMPNCMAVGATDQINQRWSELLVGSNFGPELDLVAPGVAITTTTLSNGYVSTFEGTSAAAPHVAGVAALVRGLAPTLGQGAVRDILLDSADDQVGPANEDGPGFDPYFGRGKLDANQAVLAVHPEATRRTNLQAEGNQSTDPYLKADPTLSGDGRYLAWSSWATDLVAGDTNGLYDIFVVDRGTGVVLFASLGLNNMPANGASYSPSISDDAKWISFESSASNLVSSDANGLADVFAWENFLHTSRLISASTTGTQANGNSFWSSISASGRYVAFLSDATNLVSGDTNSARDVFLRDRDTDGDGIFDETNAVSTVRVSVGPGGAQSNGIEYDPPRVSADGRHVAFDTDASNLVPGASGRQVYVRDLAMGTTVWINASGCGFQNGRVPAVSANGRFVAFTTLGGSFDTHVLAYDRDADQDGIFDEPGATACELVSRSSQGAQGNGESWRAAISDDGRMVAFSSDASNLVPGDTNGVRDLFVRDRELGLTERASVDSAGLQGNAMSGPYSAPVLTNSGHTVAFDSDASNLVVYDTNAATDVFVRELFTIDLFATSFCFCTGAPSTPPCGNAGSAGRGCRNSTGIGASLSGVGSSSVSRDDLSLTAAALPTFKPAMVFMGGGLTNGTTGNLLGDGRVCVGSGGVGVFRFPAANSGASGSITLGPGVAGLTSSLFPGAGTITAGSTFNFQCWYRDPAGPCGAGNNLSNALSVTFAP